MADVPDAEQLLQDLAWLRGLATKLARDRDDADDLVQEAWIAAWRRQPDSTRPMRGWLAKVVRDLAGMKHRSERRRAARDARADDARAPAAPDALLAQLRLHKLLVDLVLELDEPYRSTVIARFVEGRTSEAIARALGIPAGTVRKRLHTALARLRAGLDAASAGDRTRWAPAVLAFAQKGMFVAKSTKLVLVALVVLLLATAATVLIVVQVRREGTAQTTATMPRGSAATSSSAHAAGATDARTPPPLAAPRAAERATLLAAITRAREARLGRAGAPPSPAKPGTPSTTNDSTATTLDILDRTGDTSDWQKRAVGTLNKLLGECYDLGRAEDPDLAGTVMVRFKLVGEPNVGGLLEHVEVVDAETTISQATIRDCFTEQLYALELDPPPEGVTVERQLSLEVP